MTLLKSVVQLPQYYAIDISRLPPVGVDHVDISAVLQELSLLRQEVRMISQLRAELNELKVNQQNMRSIPTATTAARVMTDEFPPLASASSVDMPVLSRSATSDTNILNDMVMFAEHAKDLQREGIKPRQRQVVSKRSHKPVYGKLQNNKLKSVQTYRTIDVFVSRLHPETTTTEIVDSVAQVKDDLVICNTECTRLKSRHEHLYASFHAVITVDAADFSKALDLYMSPEAWPFGTLVKRYFRAKDGAQR